MKRAQIERLSDAVLRRYRRGQRSFFSLFGWAFLGALTCGFLVATVLGLWLGMSLVAAIGGAFFALHLCWIYGGLRAGSIIRILPYFDKAVPEADTFTHGRALARNSRQLDALAEANGWPPLSAFGFNDDLLGEKVIWHPPSQGLQTVRGLLDHLTGHPEDCTEPLRVLSDLEVVRDALAAAEKRGAQFCFLLRTGDSWSGQEMEMRHGYFSHEWKSRDHPEYFQKSPKPT